ncbi:glycosyltransferase family 39 protein [Actinosynnema sp. NPDC053489]|uniref:glycosyltransferase family 39 protein n=1 Tax=Actinosynnema sp. NPDC053489 TaxID=3363916 RepID=UPI0037C79740
MLEQVHPGTTATPPDPAPPGEDAHRWSAWREALWIFVLSRVTMVVVTVVSVAQPGGFQCLSQLRECSKQWHRFDIGYYLQIASHGYWDPRQPVVWPADGVRTEFPEAVVFFPLWPKLLGWLSVPFGRTYWHAYYVGLVLANVLGLIALWLLYQLVVERFGTHTARWSVFFLAFSPFSVTFAAGYAEALFVPLTLAVFLLVRRERWLWAGALGAVATLTRPNGVLVVIVFAVALAQRFGWRDLFTRHELGTKLKIVGSAAVVPLGLLAYVAYLWLRWDDPLAFSRWQHDYWHRSPHWPWEPVVQAVRNVLRSDSPHNDTDSLWELLFLVLPLLALGLTRKRLPPDHLLFAVAVFLMTVSASAGPVEPLSSIGRHLAGAFPVAVAYALLARNTRRQQLLLVVNLAFFGLFTAYFAVGRWMA